MVKQNKRAIVAVAILLAVFSVISFVAPFKMNVIFWIAYIFGALAIASQLYFLQSAFSGNTVKSKFYGFPIAKVGVIYLFVQVVISIVEMATSKVIPMWCVVVVNLLLVATIALGCIANETVRDEIIRQDEVISQATFNIMSLKSMSAGLVEITNDSELKKDIQKVADELKYSDPVSNLDTQAVEQDIQKLLADIQTSVADGNIEKTKELCKAVSLKVAERNRICKLSKK